MRKNNLVAESYRVSKPFVFRGVQYVPGDTFDPVQAQCVPVKLNNLIRQRILGDNGPDLVEALRDASAAPKGANTDKKAETPKSTAPNAAGRRVAAATDKKQQLSRRKS